MLITSWAQKPKSKVKVSGRFKVVKDTLESLRPEKAWDTWENVSFSVNWTRVCKTDDVIDQGEAWMALIITPTSIDYPKWINEGF